MSTFFKPYEGPRPFVFISYAHRQSDAVVGTIRILHERGWRLWYDEGIPAGSDWPANIAQHMQSCESVIFFLSARAMESPNCYSEMRTAARLGKPILVIRLEETDQDGRWRELLGGRKEIPFLDMPGERADAILRSGFLSRRFHRSWTEKIPWRALGLAVSLLFFLSAAGALGALASGRWDPVPPEQPIAQAAEIQSEEPQPAPVDFGEAERYFAVKFSDALLENGIRSALGIKTGEIFRGQLADISELYYCGGLVTNRLENVSFDAGGVCRVNGAPVLLGSISDLNALGYAVRLERLALICQPLEDVSPLNGHVLLKELSLAGSTVQDLSVLSELPSLETLHLEHTDIRDLTPLDAFPRLKTVTVSRDMLPLTWNENASFTVVLVNES